MPVNVLIADGQPLFLDALARAVRQDAELQLAGAAPDGRRALEGIRERRPHVAVLDVDLPGLAGQRVLRAVVRDRLRTAVILLAATVAPRDAYRAVADGAA